MLCGVFDGRLFSVVFSGGIVCMVCGGGFVSVVRGVWWWTFVWYVTNVLELMMNLLRHINLTETNQRLRNTWPESFASA